MMWFKELMKVQVLINRWDVCRDA